MKKLILISFIALSASCCNSIEGTSKKILNNNSDLELLFEHDGCKVYRFRDMREYRYYTDCRGSVSWSEQQGKITVDQSISTQ